MRYLCICLAAALLLAACGVPESATGAAPVQAAPTAEAQPSPEPTAEQEPTMPEDVPPTPTPARQFQAQPVSPAAETPASPPAGVPIAPPYEAGIQRSLQIAVSDLAALLSVDQATIEVAAVSSVIWPNSGLGCERAGMMYKQVPVDGLLIELRANRQVYRYHAGGARDPFLCTSPSAGAPGGDLSK